MKLPPDAIQEFQQLWLNRFGVALDEPTARIRAEKMLSMLTAVLVTPDPAPNNKGPP
jgi:hypothetical protein